MAHTDDAEEWVRLSHLYQGMSEGELLRLHEDFDDLTPVAQEVLLPILKTRGLGKPPLPTPATLPTSLETSKTSPFTSGGVAEHVDLDSLLEDSGVAVRAFESMEDAGLLSDYLRARGIRCCMITTKRGYASRVPEILVFPEDLERAVALLDDADLAALRQAAEGDGGTVFEESSVCPACGSNEILLQPEVPGALNVWLCDRCGNRWQDNLPDGWTAAG